ncbi:FecCD family ABC transporter permease [Entomobacter blattae]|uniref:Putative ABC transporter permease protein n=1 Tax=Entomobacter blattae TaxID=2762277 RepID=A0A7H1NQ36_9PROT|nr:iron ABC transporter permease [Entomobacter blattae]QNT77896.1 putative ABC transporter permease protein [Entomobacter blattae]
MFHTRLFIAVSCVLIIAMFLCLLVGRYPVTVSELMGALWHSPVQNFSAKAGLVYSLVHSVRLPRVLGAVLIGAALGVSGGAYQAVFRNPLVSPGMLGVLSGAGFGAALAIIFRGDGAMIGASAFIGGIAAAGMGITIARIFNPYSIMMLIFGGLVSSAFFTALLSLLKFIADPQGQLPDIVFWLLGTLARLDMAQVQWLFVPVIGSIAVLSFSGKYLDALAMGDEEAASLGVPVVMTRMAVIILATILAAMTVSLVGIIGWVGLIVPHIARFMVGPVNRHVIPMSALVGGIFLLVCDTVARDFSSQEIPIGIMTDLIGVMVFLVIIRFTSVKWDRG